MDEKTTNAADEYGLGAAADGMSHSRLGDYELLEQIGQGGMGTVYKCLDVALHRHVAIKVLHLDDEVDTIKNDAYDRIKQAIAGGLTEDIGYMINLLLISRHIERLADHATNIAEEVVYMIEGEIVRHGKLE